MTFKKISPTLEQSVTPKRIPAGGAVPLKAASTLEMDAAGHFAAITRRASEELGIGALVLWQWTIERVAPQMQTMGELQKFAQVELERFKTWEGKFKNE